MIYEPLIVNEVDVSSTFPDKPFHFDFEKAFLEDQKADVVSILRRASEQTDLAKKLYPIVTEVECLSDSESDSPVTRTPIRILMLHGYTHSGDFFSAKTRKLRERITANLRDELALSDDEEIEFLYPDAPNVLRASEIPGSEVASEDDNEELRGWFDINSQPFLGTEQAVGWIVDYMRRVGPIDGIVGFSQGGALAMMIASLCEGQTNPARLEALANQPISMNFEPPQGPVKFAVSLSGFRGTTNHHEGFYNPMITTPALCIVGDLDIMVERELSDGLIEACRDVKVVHHRGGHYVPTDNKSVDAAASFIRDRMVESFY